MKITSQTPLRPIRTPVRAAGAAQQAPEGPGSSPEAYRTALIHLGTRAKMIQGQLAEAKVAKDPERVRLLREDLVQAYLELWEVKQAVGDTRALAWKAAGFDVAAAWQVHGVPLPPLDDLRKEAAVRRVDWFGKMLFGTMGACFAMAVAVLVAGLALHGRIPGAIALRGAILFKDHMKLGLTIAAAAGFFGGAPIIQGVNTLLGHRRAPRPIAD